MPLRRRRSTHTHFRQSRPSGGAPTKVASVRAASSLVARRPSSYLGLGIRSFSWIMRSEIDEPGIPSGVAIVGSDDATGEYFMLYFDERGVSRKYDGDNSR